MKSREILSVVILALGITAAMLPSRKNDSIQLTEKELLQEMLLKTNYVSVDELAHLLIIGDPSIQLIDVRPMNEFKEPLRGAINIPLDSVFSERYAYLFDQDIMKNIIYGEGDQVSTQVWVMMKHLGYANNYLLKGGLKAWNRDILNPVYPDQIAPQDEFDLYERRSAARQFFTGAKALPKIEFKPMAPVGGRKKKRVEGGCS
ncbi:MAG: rhodanese-like domain-containing protein [Reichenbachiella sp.]